MERRPPRSTLNDTLLPYTTLFRSDQRAQLHLAEGAAGLDVAEHALEVADADRQLLHLAQAALHRFQALGDELERRVQAGVERGLQLFIDGGAHRSEEHTSELQSLMRISYAVFCLKKKKNRN